MPSAIDLTTLATVKLPGMGNPGNNQDGTIAALITACSRAFMTLTSRTDYIAGQNLMEVRDGTGTDALVMGHFPVTQFGPLQIEGVPIPAGQPASPSYMPYGYFIDSERGIIRLVGYRFPKVPASVVYTYTFGFSAIPEDVGQSVAMMVAFVLRQMGHIDRVTETLAAQVVRYATDFPYFVCETIKRYARTQRTSSPSYNTSLMSGGGAGTPPVDFIATAGQTMFVLPFIPTGYLLWFRNGIIQTGGGVDYSISGATVTVVIPASDGDSYKGIYQN